MDQSFLLRAQRLLRTSAPARLDHDLLVAAVAALQATSPTARAQRRLGEDVPGPHGLDGIEELVLAGPEWRAAAAAQHGRFVRAETGRPVNGL